jgi:cytoskeletal protein CcmA (bactofilin family)
MSEAKGAGSGRKTLVDEGTQFKGSLSSDCPIEVKGRIEGEVAAPSLVVSPTGAMRGRVKVAELRSEGELAGEFDADTVQLSGTVKDNTVIRAKSLEVKLAAPDGKMQVVFGECELQVGDEQASKETAPTRASERPKRGKGSIPPEAEAN